MKSEMYISDIVTCEQKEIEYFQATEIKGNLN